MVVHLLCLSHTAVKAILQDPELSPEAIAHGLFGSPPDWPSSGQLVVELNSESGSHEKAWFVQKPVSTYCVLCRTSCIHGSLNADSVDHAFGYHTVRSAWAQRPPPDSPRGTARPPVRHPCRGPIGGREDRYLHPKHYLDEHQGEVEYQEPCIKPPESDRENQLQVSSGTSISWKQDATRDRDNRHLITWSTLGFQDPLVRAWKAVGLPLAYPLMLPQQGRAIAQAQCTYVVPCSDASSTSWLGDRDASLDVQQVTAVE